MKNKKLLYIGLAVVVAVGVYMYMNSMSYLQKKAITMSGAKVTPDTLAKVSTFSKDELKDIIKTNTKLDLS